MQLYIFWFLHQTTTGGSGKRYNFMLYIFWFLHQTTTEWMKKTLPMCCISFDSYIKPQQENAVYAEQNSCISFDSYIKPQHILLHPEGILVVYLLIPTSNHNSMKLSIVATMLYIFWFLHQTTTAALWDNPMLRCISFDSYIKPQLLTDAKKAKEVVYLLIPTSNHNMYFL